MRVIFLGTPVFCLPTLRVLIKSQYKIVAVCTQPDRPAGRGNQLRTPPAKLLALDHDIPVYQPVCVRAEENLQWFQSLKPDFLVVVAFGQILPRWLLDVPRIAPVNVHASLLPKYRGAAPVAHALLRGETTTGVTTMRIEETLDTGPILLRHEVPVPDDITCGELEAILSDRGADLILPTLDGLSSGTLRPQAQKHDEATLAPKISKEMALIDWNRSATLIHNQIRAFNPWPLAYSDFRGQKLQIFRSRVAPLGSGAGEGRIAGSIVEINGAGLTVKCGDGQLELLQVQISGRKQVSGREFAIGARLARDETLFTLNAKF